MTWSVATPTYGEPVSISSSTVCRTPDGGAERLLVRAAAAPAVEVAEELVGAVDEVDAHGGARMAESPA